MAIFKITLAVLFGFLAISSVNAASTGDKKAKSSVESSEEVSVESEYSGSNSSEESDYSEIAVRSLISSDEDNIIAAVENFLGKLNLDAAIKTFSIDSVKKLLHAAEKYQPNTRRRGGRRHLVSRLLVFRIIRKLFSSGIGILLLIFQIAHIIVKATVNSVLDIIQLIVPQILKKITSLPVVG